MKTDLLEQNLTELQPPAHSERLLDRCLSTIPDEQSYLNPRPVAFVWPFASAAFFAGAVLAFMHFDHERILSAQKVSGSNVPIVSVSFAEVDAAMRVVNTISGEQIDEHFDKKGKLTSELMSKTSATITPEQGMATMYMVYVPTGVATPFLRGIYSSKGVFMVNFIHAHPNQYTEILFSNTNNRHRENYGLGAVNNYIHPDELGWREAYLDPKSISLTSTQAGTFDGKPALVLKRTAYSKDHSTYLVQTIWADPATKRAMHLEVFRTHTDGSSDKTILQNIVCNASFPPHYFDQTIPKGAPVKIDHLP